MPPVSSLFLKSWYSLLGTRRLAKRHSIFKIGFTAIFVFFLEAGLFAMFVSGFKFLGRLEMVLHALFSLFFLGLGAMLVISSILASYAAMFRSDEIEFLLVRPFNMAQIALYKFVESCALSSWAMFFILIPFVGAYTLHENLGWPFVIWTFLFCVPFTVFCCAVGTLVTMTCVRWTPHGSVFRISLLVVFIVTVALAWTGQYMAKRSPDASTLILARMVPGLRLSANPLLPSWWIAEGIMSFSGGEWRRGSLSLAMLSSSALLLSLAVESLGRATYYKAWQRVAASTDGRARRKPLFEALDRRLRFLPADVRAMIVKDVRTFVRDPLQWSQFLIFFGLLALYFASLRSFRYDQLDDRWRVAVAFLNIFSVTTVVCSLASRFIYPQLSLEGHGFWILGLSPTSMGRILMTKFGLSLFGLAIVSVGLMALSTGMLRAPAELQAVAIAIGLSISLGISGISTGCGAIYMDLRERNPAAIVSGFGGTLNLVVSLAYMFLSVFPFAAVFYLEMLARIPRGLFQKGLAVCFLWLFLLTTAAVAIPLALGRRALNTREY